MKRSTVAILATGAAVVIVVGTLRNSTAPEPHIQGKTAKTWALELNDPSSATREAAVAVIRTFDANEVPRLLELLRTPDPVLARPIRFIAARSPKRFSRFLYRVVNPFEAPAHRAAAAQAYRIMGSHAQAAVPALAAALRADQTVAWHAALALSQLGPAGTRALTGALADTAPSQRGFVCYALSTQGEAASNAVPALALILRTADPQVADKAAAALGKLGRSAVPELASCLVNTNLQVRLLTAQALESIGPPARPVIPTLLGLYERDAPAMRVAALKAMSHIQPRADLVFATLAKALRDPVRAVRMEALEAVSQSPRREELTHDLIGLLDDQSADIRARAATLLGATSADRDAVLAALKQRLNDENDVVRAKAREAIANLPPKENVVNGDVGKAGRK